VGRVDFMKFLLVSGIYFPDIGGPATYIPRIAHALIAEGHTVTTLSLTDDVNRKLPEEPWSRILVSRTLLKPFRFLKTLRFILKSKPDSEGVYSNGLYEECGVASVFGVRLLVAKIVGDPIWERFRNSQDSTISIGEFQSKNLSLFFKMQRKFLVRSLNRFGMITTPSAELARFIEGWGVKRPVVVIPNGVNCHLIQKKSSDNSVVSVSRLVSWKNIDLLIQACAETNLALKVIGEGPERAKLEATAREFGADVSFLGEIKGDGVVQVLSESGVFALISDYEGLSFALLEAMMVGIPVVVSSNAGNTQVIQNEVNGLVVSIGNLDQTKQALSRLITDNHLKESLSKNAKALVMDKYCEEKQISQMINALKSQVRHPKNV
jgi:glycosyltransferase involved in cell wall biosynthesis